MKLASILSLLLASAAPLAAQEVIPSSPAAQKAAPIVQEALYTPTAVAS